MNKIVLTIEGMTCQGCVRSVEKKLSGVTGVDGAHVDLEAGRATVDYDDEITGPAQFSAAVEQIGYKAELS